MGSCISFTQAKEVAIHEKSLQLLLTDVANINLTAYTSNIKPEQSDSYLSLSRQTTDFTLLSDKSSLRVRCSFIDNQLQKIYISDNVGEISVNSKAANVVDDAKVFLQKYQAYSNNGFYGTLQSMLDNVTLNENATKVVANAKLDVRVYGQAMDIVWTYVDCFGVEAPVKNVALSYEFGTLKSFVNNWPFYTVAGEPNISREQAVDLALDVVANFSYAASVSGENVSVSGFKVASVGNASLCYLNYQEANLARDNDPFTLYPSWFVPLGFDKFYPSNIAGAYVRFWADTGEVCDIVPMIVDSATYISNTTDVKIKDGSEAIWANTTELQAHSDSFFVFAPILLIVLAVFVVYSGMNKSRFFSINKKGTSKPLAALLCCLLFVSLIIIFVPKADAYSTTEAGSLIFGSLMDQYSGTIEIPGRGTVSFAELTAVDHVTSTVNDYFENNGYDDVHKYYGFNKYILLNEISNMEASYDSIAVLYLGHKADIAGDSYWVEGDVYNKVSADWDDIDDYTTGNVFFVWSWTCDSANTPISGLPVAWTGGQLFDSRHCYIGFDGASPCLSAASFQDTTGLGMDFINSFYYYALEIGLNVWDSLNEASTDVFGGSYGSTSLDGGFYTYWPIGYEGGPYPGWKEGKMNVFGNRYIYLVQDPDPAPPPPANVVLSGGWAWYPPAEQVISIPCGVWLDSVWIDLPYGVNPYLQLSLSSGAHEIEFIDPIQDYDTTYYLLDIIISGNVVTQNPTQFIAGSELFQIWAEYGFKLNVSSTTGGSTDFNSTQILMGGQTVTITATPQQGYTLHHWLLDGVPMQYGDPTFELFIDKGYDLEAVFVPCHTLTVQYGAGGSASADGTVYVNGTVATITAYPGEHYVLDYWTINQTNAGNANPLQLTMTANYTVTAHFLDVSQLPHHHLTVQVQGPGTAFSYSYVYLADAQATVYASANGGCTFIGWTVDGDAAGFANPLGLTMNTDHVVVAYFAYDWELTDFSIYAMYGLYQPVEVPLTIDGNIVGTTEGTYRVTQDYHTLEVPEAVYADGEWHYFVCFSLMTYFGMVLDYWEDNPGVVPIVDQGYSGNIYVAAYT
jgi:hypothetical protein